MYSVVTNENRIIKKPVYSVSSDGRWALTLDFSRLHRLREGYGYSNTTSATFNTLINKQSKIAQHKTHSFLIWNNCVIIEAIIIGTDKTKNTYKGNVQPCDDAARASQMTIVVKYPKANSSK